MARAALVIWVCLLAAGCGERERPRPQQPARLTLEVERVAAMRADGAVTAAFGSIWVGDASGTLLRIDPRSGDVEARFRVPNEGLMAAAEGALWLPDFGAGVVRRVDPQTGRVTRAVRTPGAPAYVTAAGGSVYVSLHHGSRVDRIEARTGRVTARIRAAEPPLERGGPQGLAVAEGRVWTGIPLRKQVVPVDPKGPPVAVEQEPCGGMVAAGEDVWISPGMCGFRLMHVRDGRPLPAVQLADAAVGEPVLAEGSLWVTTADGGLHRLDPRSGRVLARGRATPTAPSLAAAAPGVFYAAGREGVFRITVR